MSCVVRSPRLQHSRTFVLEQFWLQRKELQLLELERPASAPISSRIKNRRADTSRNTHDRKRQPTGGGILQCINGVLCGTNFGTWCKGINLPLLLISSTRDSLDSSQTAQVSQWLILWLPCHSYAQGKIKSRSNQVDTMSNDGTVDIGRSTSPVDM